MASSSAVEDEHLTDSDLTDDEGYQAYTNLKII